MPESALILTPDGLAALMGGGLDLDTDAMYACLASGNFTPTLALTEYSDLTSATTGAITGATAANPVVISDTAHGRTTGDLVDISGVGGMTQLNGNSYKITVIDANSFSLQDGNGNNIDGSAFTAYTSGGTWTLQYEIKAYGDYARQVIGSAALINYGTSNKGRAFDSAIINFGSNVSVSAKYCCLFRGTAASPVSTDQFIGWIDLNYTGGALTAITKANPVQVTRATHGLSNGDTVCIYGSDMQEVNRGIFTVTTVDGNNVTIGVDLSAADYTGTGGTMIKLNDTTEAASNNSNFTVDAAATGWVALG